MRRTAQRSELFPGLGVISKQNRLQGSKGSINQIFNLIQHYIFFVSPLALIIMKSQKIQRKLAAKASDKSAKSGARKGRYQCIPQVPVVCLTHADLAKDFIKVVSQFQNKYRQIGAVILKRPEDWQPSVPHPSQDFFLTTRQQKLNALGQGKAFQQTKDSYLFSEFREAADQFQKLYIDCTQPNGTSRLDQDEEQYWNLVVDPKFKDENVEVDYAADLSTKECQSFFKNKDTNKYKFSSSSFNLGNLELSPNNMTARSFRTKGEVSGVTQPWLYIAMKFCSFCWHVEDLYMHSVNYNHRGGVKCWYVIPEQHRQRFEQFVASEEKKRGMARTNSLSKITLMIDPLKVLAAGIPVYKARQQAGSYVITFPQAYHCGFSHSYNICEAVNFVPYSAYTHLRQADQSYRKASRCPILPIQWLLIKNEEDPRVAQELERYIAKCEKAKQKFGSTRVQQLSLQRHDKHVCRACRRYCVGLFVQCAHRSFCVECYQSCCSQQKTRLVVQKCNSLKHLI